MSDPEADVRRRINDAAGTAAQAADVARKGLSVVTERAQELAKDADKHISNWTGRPLDRWLDDVRHYVEQHPLQATIITIGLGYLLGRVRSRE